MNEATFKIRARLRGNRTFLQLCLALVGAFVPSCLILHFPSFLMTENKLSSDVLIVAAWLFIVLCPLVFVLSVVTFCRVYVTLTNSAFIVQAHGAFARGPKTYLRSDIDRLQLRRLRKRLPLPWLQSVTLRQATFLGGHGIIFQLPEYFSEVDLHLLAKKGGIPVVGDWETIVDDVI